LADDGSIQIRERLHVVLSHCEARVKPDREIDMLPSKTVGRRREGAASPGDAEALLRTAWALRGRRGLAPRGLFRFQSFEEAQEWIRTQMSRRSGLQPSKMSVESAGLALPVSSDLDARKGSGEGRRLIGQQLP
jgi:hypothetical protein